MANKPTYILIHHSGVSYKVNPNQFNAINAYHKKKGWGMIGYHYLIEKNGKKKVGRRERTVGAHAGSKWNARSVGICLTGDFRTDKPTTKQKATLKKLVGEVRKRHKIPIRNVKGHGEVISTACPGKYLLAYVKVLRKPKPKVDPCRGVKKELGRAAVKVSNLTELRKVDARVIKVLKGEKDALGRNLSDLQRDHNVTLQKSSELAEDYQLLKERWMKELNVTLLMELVIKKVKRLVKRHA